MTERIRLTDSQWYALANGATITVGDYELVPPHEVLYMLTDEDVYGAAEERGYARDEVSVDVLDSAAKGFAYGCGDIAHEAINSALDEAGLDPKDDDTLRLMQAGEEGESA